MLRHSPVNETSGPSTSMPRTDSIWDERTPLVGMPTNGKAALAAIMLEQNTPEEFCLYGTDQVAAAAPPEITDQLLFQRLKGRAGTGTMIWAEMMRNPVFKVQCGAFRVEFEQTIGRPLRKLTLDFWKIFIMKNNFSTELATALTVIAITEGTTGQSHIELRQTRANTLRVMLYLEMYLDTQDHLLDVFFEDVKDEQLDFTKVTGQTHPSPTERPGFHRLADKDPVARNA